MPYPIVAQNLTKQYFLEHKYPTLRDSVKRWFKKKNPTQEQVFHAIYNLNFSIEAGETIGLLGNNGSGKSTLLKILSRITTPTQGRALITGRVASLLEVGTGFHPDLTGKENIYLNGILLGMTKKEVLKKYDEIVAFSEIQNFLHTPVKYYSSGMYSRLAFSIATALSPDILLLDEILGVGDFNFQRRCLEKAKTFIKEGRTVVLVSHDLETIRALCKRCIILENGHLKYFGLTEKALEIYMQNQELVKKTSQS